MFNALKKAGNALAYEHEKNQLDSINSSILDFTRDQISIFLADPDNDLLLDEGAREGQFSNLREQYVYKLIVNFFFIVIIF